jgi:hypothetical protein
MSSTKSLSDKQQGEHNQQTNDPKRMGNNPVEPQKNDRNTQDNQQMQKDKHSQRSNQPTR